MSLNEAMNCGQVFGSPVNRSISIFGLLKRDVRYGVDADESTQLTGDGAGGLGSLTCRRGSQPIGPVRFGIWSPV